MSRLTRYLVICSLGAGGLAALMHFGESLLDTPAGNEVRTMWQKPDVVERAQSARDAVRSRASDAQQTVHDRRQQPQ